MSSCPVVRPPGKGARRNDLFELVYIASLETDRGISMAPNEDANRLVLQNIKFHLKESSFDFESALSESSS